MIDFFPTVIDLLGLPKIAACTGVDQPPTVQCLQGESYAAEFLPSLAMSHATPKANIFSQWYGCFRHYFRPFSTRLSSSTFSFVRLEGGFLPHTNTRTFPPQVHATPPFTPRAVVYLVPMLAGC